MAVKLISTKELAKINGVKMGVYSRAGIGKTRLCATLPNPVIFSAESGLLSLREYDLPVVEISTVEELKDAYEWAYGSTEAQQFESVCLDSCSEVAEVVLSNAKKKTTNNGKLVDPRHAYGDLIGQMLDTLRAFRDLKGKHVYFSFKQTMNKDEHTGMQSYGPMMPGRVLPQEIPYKFDELFHLDVGKTEGGELFRYFRTCPDLQYEGKDRSGSLEQIESPDLGYIIKKILGE